MEQYLKLLREIKEKGTWKSPSRPNLPRTLSLFGYQYRCKLDDGFPLLTTKKVSLKNIATELLWFLRSDGKTLNIKYLIDNGCNIWNEDSYRWYVNCVNDSHFTLEQFIYEIKSSNVNSLSKFNEKYKLGDCPLGYELWRNFNEIDQIAELIDGLKKYPENRGHQLTALNPAYRDVALRPCHVYAQFNCREIDIEKRCYMAVSQNKLHRNEIMFPEDENQTLDEQLNEIGIPKYYLDCQLYQRSADVFLGVPYNTASYSLLTHIIAEICGFVVGDFVHTFGDVHIYENQMEAVDEQLSRNHTELPKLKINNDLKVGYNSIDDLINVLEPHWFSVENYNPQPTIKAKLSTGLK